jgi:hypothetical protein
MKVEYICNMKFELKGIAKKMRYLFIALLISGCCSVKNINKLEGIGAKNNGAVEIFIDKDCESVLSIWQNRSELETRFSGLGSESIGFIRNNVSISFSKTIDSFYTFTIKASSDLYKNWSVDRLKIILGSEEIDLSRRAALSSEGGIGTDYISTYKMEFSDIETFSNATRTMVSVPRKRGAGEKVLVGYPNSELRLKTSVNCLKNTKITW